MLTLLRIRLLFSSAGTGFPGYEFRVDLIYVPFLLYAVAMTGNLLLYRRFFRGYEPPPSAGQGPREPQAADEPSPDSRPRP